MKILKARLKAVLENINILERKEGVVGYFSAQETLEKVSEQKSEMDEAKGKALNEISEIVEKVMKSINEKKAKIAPVIQELRNVRQQCQELEAEYSEKKRVFDAIMLGLDSDANQLDHEVKNYRQDILNDQSRVHYLQQMCQAMDINQERVMQEMKAYIGGDDALEHLQKQRGFKSYRDLYHKKITEQENLGKTLRESQKDVKVVYVFACMQSTNWEQFIEGEA
ncbi:hypothetical protein BJ742DRAFT_48404 [Cladochytrium replicatum]|nr:hypothetical protein BJ742DRAFT_48404 [Cladochytrium replicatum]